MSEKKCCCSLPRELVDKEILLFPGDSITIRINGEKITYISTNNPANIRANYTAIPRD